MRCIASFVVVAALAGSARAGELDLDLGLQATTTAWPEDHGGGGTLGLSYWFLPWLGATYLGKEQYAMVDQRFMTYLSINAAARAPLGPLRIIGTLGVVHQHEETQSSIMHQPIESVFGVGDGIRHRMAARSGASLEWPFTRFGWGDLYAAVDLDATVFADNDRGPRWMASAGMSVGVTYDFARRK